MSLLSPAAAGMLNGYDPSGFFCELEHGLRSSPHGQVIRARLDAMTLGALAERARTAETELYNQGITFTVYTEGDAIDRILPFDVIPRVITAADWAVIEAGVHQRVVISSDGSEARKAVGDPKSPARWLVVGIVDEKEPGVPV